MAIAPLRPYQSLTTIVFIDGALPDLQTILTGLDPTATAIALDPAQDGIRQMADALAGMSGLDAIHIISHGASGQINLGTAQLTQDTLAQYQTQLAAIGNALSPTGDLLLYGCNVAQGDVGQAFISALANATGADVAASTDLTGATFLGGNWQLESSTGLIESTVALSPVSQENYNALLPIINQSPSYDLGNAYDLMALSVAAYQDGATLEQTLGGLGWSPITSADPTYVSLDMGGGYASSNAYAFAATRDFGGKHQMVISFRGTEPTQLGDIWSDIGAWGFTDYYKNVRPLVEEAIRQAIDSNCDQIFITGHSLGGAAAQLAMLDLMLPRDTALWTTSIWPHIASDRLGTSDRIGSSGSIQFSASDWNWLHQSGRVAGATIGAPDASVDPYKATALEAAIIGNSPLTVVAQELIAVIATHALVSTFGYDINNSLGSAFFRFEQTRDIVAAVGLPTLNEVGQQVNIDLSPTLQDLYPYVPHSSNAYTESVLRAIFNYPLISSTSTLTDTLITLPYQSAGTSGNDLLLGSSLATAVLGGNGNDILIGAGTCTLTGGGGNDIYVVSAPGCNITITGSANDTGDRLFLGPSFGRSDLGVTEAGANLVLTFHPSGGTESIITIQNWYSSTSTYELAQVSFLNGDPYRATGPEPYLTLSSYDIGLSATNPVADIGIPFFLTGGSGDDTVWGSPAADILHGNGGRDELQGGAGSDTLYGGAGNDTLNGGSGANTVYGESGDDTYIIDENTASTYTNTITDSSGNDLIIVNSDNADYTKTHFAVSGNDLIVEIRGTANQLLSTIDIQSSSISSAVENMRIASTNGSLHSYDLNYALGLAIDGVALSVQPPQPDDYSQDIFTTGLVAIGGSTDGNISFQDERDWFKVNLVAGHSYRFDVKGAPSSQGTLGDPYMRLRDEAGVSLLSDDNSGTGADAQISYTATSTGFFFVSAGSADTTSLGTYRVFATDLTAPVTVLNSAPDVVGTAQALTAGTTLSASNLFHGVDREGDPIVSYTINDATGSGYFQLNSVQKAEGSSFTVTATEYDTLQYVVGSAGTSDTFAVRASDGHAWGAENAITVTGMASGTAPGVVAAQNDTATTTSGTPVVVNVLSNDTNLTRITSITGTNSHATIQPGAQDLIIVTPPLDFVGTYSFAYTATNAGGGSASALVTVQVAQPLAVNHSPVAQDIHHIVVAEQQDQIEPLVFCSDPDVNDSGLLTLVSYSNPNHGSLTRSGNTLTYTPASGFAGDDAYSYVIQDPHGAQATGTITETVYQAVTANDDFVVTDPNTPVTFNVLQNDAHAGSGQYVLYAAGFSQPASHGTLTFSQDGQVIYTPVAGYTGMDSFDYRAEYSGTVNFSSAIVTIAVGASSSQQGGAGADQLTGSSGSDGLYGNGGNDTLWGGAGNDILDGGAGFDTVSFAGAPMGISVDLGLPYVFPDGSINWSDPYYWANDGLGGQDSVRNCEAVVGSEFADTIRGNNSDNVIYGNGGNDDIMTGLGRDTIYCGDGNDTLWGGGGFYTVYGGNGNDQLSGGVNTDVLDGGAGNDWLGDGLGGNDTITGGEGDDTFRCYGNGVCVLDGGDGNDSIWGKGTLIGGNGNDYLVVTSNNSSSPGVANANDTLLGGAGDDTLSGGTGNDILDGGSGYDTVWFGLGVTADLASGFAQTSSGFSVLTSIEIIHCSVNGANDIIYGSEAAETFYGDAGNDTLVGRGGNDIIDGGSGSDVIEGGSGADTLTGGGYSNIGGGSDRFVYRSTLDGGDVITDFTVGAGWAGSDILDFTDILSSAGYSGSTPSADGYLRLAVSGNSTTLLLDRDGTGTGAQFVALATLQGVLPNALISANFATPVDLAALIAAVPASLSIEVGTTLQKPGTDAPAIYEGDSGNTDLVIRLIREGDLSVPLTATVDYVAGPGLDALDFVGGVPVSGTIDFAAGQSTLEKTISVVGDTIFEADEKLSVSVSSLNSTNSPSTSIWILTEENRIDGNGTLIGTTRADSITGHEQDDFILSGDGNDTIYGDAGNDTLDGGLGADTMVGGLGNDTYMVDNTGDVLTESTNEGIDLVQSSITYTLADNIENLLLTGSDNLDGTGNALDNVLTGNAGNNTLTGAGGNDTLTGAGGNDVFAFAASGNGIDTITDFSPGNRITVTGAVFSGTVTAGNGSAVLANQIQLSVAGGVTTLYIGTDSIAGADVQIQLTGAFSANTFLLSTNQITLNSIPNGSVNITGTATQNQTLSAANTLADADGLGAINYQWQADGIAINGATNDTYVLADAQVFKSITVAASYTDGYGTAESVTSAATDLVANVNDAPTGSVTIIGTATQSQVLTATNTLADIDGLGVISYQWQADGVNISGATDNTYLLTEAEVGKAISVAANYTDVHGTAESMTSFPTSAVLNVNDAPTGSVTISGTAAKGQTLTASNTLADIDGLSTIGYQWQANSVAIVGATNSTYVLTQAEVGKSISVVASYTDLYGTAEAATSSGSAIVYAPATSRYTLLGTGADFMDFSIPYGNLSLDGQCIVYKGNSGIDTVYVGSAAGLAFDFTQAGLGVDQIYLSGNWADYSRTASGSVVTLTRTIGGNETIKTISGDSLIFADGTVSVLDALNFLKGTAAEPAPVGATSTAFPMPVAGPLNNTVRAVVQDASGETIALSRPGVAMIVKGGSGVDVVYIASGANVDGTQLGLGQDKLYLTGNWADYGGTYAGSVVTLTRAVGADTETVKFLGGSASAYDSIVFADGTASSIDVLNYVKGTALAPALSATEVTPLGTGGILAGTAGADILNGTAAAEVIYGNGGADTINGGAGNDTIVIADAGATALISATVVFTSTANGTDTLIGFSAAPVANGGDVLDFSAIAHLAKSVATGQTLTTDFAADNVFIFDGAPVTIADAANAIAADVSVVATDGYIVIADQANHNAVTVYHSSDLAGNTGAETALAILSGVNITNLTAANFLV